MAVSVILRSDVAKLGKVGDVIEVANGYARNYLIPRGLALPASDGAIAQAAAMRRSRDIRNARERGEAEEVARQLVPTVIALSSKAGGEGRLYGSITAADVVKAVETQTGIQLDRRKLAIDESIRTVGTHQVTAKLHAEVEFPITLEISAL